MITQKNLRTNKESRGKWKLINEKNLKVCTICNQEKILDSFYKLPNASQNFKEEGIYQIITPGQAATLEQIIHHPLCGGMPIDAGWESLQLYVDAISQD